MDPNDDPRLRLPPSNGWQKKVAPSDLEKSRKRLAPILG